MSDQTPPESRATKSKARERQRKRKERRLRQGQTGAPSRRSRQLTPEGGFELPSVNLQILRPIALAGAAVIFVVSLIVAIGLFKGSDPTIVETGEPNALWIGDDWTYENRSEAEVLALVARMQENEIGSVYAYVSDLNVDNTWTGDPDGLNQFSEVQDEVIAFVQSLKSAYGEIEIYGALGVQAGLDADGYRLDDIAVQQAVAEFSAQAVDTLGIDGILLNVDLVSNGDSNYLALLRAIRRAMPPDAKLGIATPPDWTPSGVDIPTPTLIAEGAAWDAEYKQRVALIQIDQMVVQAYNSYLDDPADYSEWVAYQTQAFAEALFEIQAPTDILIGVPTYDNSPPAHIVRVENIRTALAGVQQGLIQAGPAAANVPGVAIYADWSMSEVEWTQFNENWIVSE